MNKKIIAILAILPIVVLGIVSCDLFPPQNALQLYGTPSYTDIGGNITINFELQNIGSETLSNCKVRWYVDETPNGSIDFDEITGWAPATGVAISGPGTSGPLSVSTTTGIVVANIEYYGIYAWGWDNPPDE